jgi:hypothetical protein
MKALEGRTGAAKTSVLTKVTKVIYNGRRIVVVLSGLDLMKVSACQPELLYKQLVVVRGPHFHERYSSAITPSPPSRRYPSKNRFANCKACQNPNNPNGPNTRDPLGLGEVRS